MRLARLAPIALVLPLAACADNWDGAADETGATERPEAPGEAVLTPAEAETMAAEWITEENADAEFQTLEKEILEDQR